ncbi:MAG: calcium/sodium antiporter [Cetobacterium sp.]|uniref:calcium/sodium antiporter n=1 Tax=unclassified Cetobacterium TaxID=2630983 RepID=UPI00163D1E4E|nr:calcium/sodium antiporter [Cetobacterium sp. 2A]MBC2855266.1 calcium/sodium antiporter [Cetobacterium sp. 2A]MBC2855648.1 calcium/sodium antiporter [Cetobacterium sp. 2A]
MAFVMMIIGVIALVYGANFLVDGASVIAKRFNIPNLVIGLTIVAFGTSAPELVVNVIASVQGHSAITLGNVIGSNLINTLVILGITALIYPLTVSKTTTYVEIPMSLLAAFIVFLMANDMYFDGITSVIGKVDGSILLLFFLIFLAYNFYLMVSSKEEEELEIKNYTPLVASLAFVGGLVLLILGGKFIVDSAVEIASGFGVSERIISLTVVALGTSLPELATSVVAAMKKNSDLAIGNVVGSNIFNIFFILGISTSIAPITMMPGSNLEIGINVFASLLLLLFVARKKNLQRWQGAIMIGVYGIYLIKLLNS